MHRSQLVLLLAVLACGASKPDAGAIDAAPTEACRAARELRAAAAELERTGHLLLARGKLGEANATCAEEHATSSALEAKVLADLGDCTKATAVAIEADGGATAAEVKTLCDERTAAPLGTDVTMRAKMRAAFNAARAKEYPRARSLFLDAWKEHHPSPLALEDAARMAALAGDAAGARRTSDRALAEAEATEHAAAIVTNRVRASAGDARLVSGTLTVADAGKVVARDLATGELRVLLDVDARWMRLSPLGTLAMTMTMTNDVVEVQVYDLLTGQLLLDGERVHFAIPSQDDALIAVGDEGKWRVVDVATGDVRAKLEGDAFARLEIAGFGAGGTLIMLARKKEDDGSRVLRVWDLEKKAFGSFTAASQSFVGLSPDGRYLANVSLPSGSDGNPFDAAMLLTVRNLEAGTLVAQWTGRFATLGGLSVSPDAKTVATESQNSVRLWDVATKKQTFIAARTRRGDNYDSDLGRDAFSDDGKTVVLGREARTMLWDVATDVETEVVSNQRRKDVLRVVPFGEAGIVLVSDDEVRVVPFVGDAHAMCKGFHQRYYPDVGPTNAVVSPSGKSLACTMSGGAVHVFDTATWQERSHIDGPAPTFKQGFGGFVWAGVPPAVRPVDLAFSTDDASLTIVSDAAIATYDATTGKQLSKVTLRAPKLALAARHAVLDGGRVLVKTTSGSGAIFDASGAFDREVSLVPGAPIDAPDAFSADGKTYAVAIGNALHTVDIASGSGATTDLPVRARTLALSPDGKASVVVGTDGAVYEVGGDSDAGAVHKVETGAAKRAFFTAKARVFVTDPGDTLELSVRGHTRVLEVDPNGLIARSASGTFELRGKPEAECVVGRVQLTQETCADRAESGLVEAWLRDAH